MKTISRFLGSIIPLAKKSKSIFPDVDWDEEFAGFRFRLVPDWKAQEISANSSGLYKKPYSITCNGEKITGVIYASPETKHKSHGEHIIVSKSGEYYESVDPVTRDMFSYDEPDFDIGDVVDGNYYSGGKIMSHWSGTSYVLAFADGSEDIFDMSSMKHLWNCKESNIHLELSKNYKKASAIAAWLKENGVSDGIITMHFGSLHIPLNWKKAVNKQVVVGQNGTIWFNGKVFIKPEDLIEYIKENFGLFLRNAE